MVDRQSNVSHRIFLDLDRFRHTTRKQLLLEEKYTVHCMYVVSLILKKYFNPIAKPCFGEKNKNLLTKQFYKNLQN